MKFQDQNNNKHIDIINDITSFADESFDTEGIDLFEFTGKDESPLTPLKAAVLSLDWEITDDILDEFSLEVKKLQEHWADNKIAQIYLEGLEKIGDYIKEDGVHAHPNAIKLLLIFFHNFEKIISAQDIPEDRLDALVKSDVRKFNVLQHQIKEYEENKGASTSSLSGPTTNNNVNEEKSVLEEYLTNLHAAILELDWEVTDNGIKYLDTQLQNIKEELSDNQAGTVLAQGLQVLSRYLAEEKANVHPDTFNQLHYFFEGLNSIVSEELNEEREQEIMVTRITSLNNLKKIITPAQDDKVSASEEITASSDEEIASSVNEEVAGKEFAKESNSEKEEVPATEIDDKLNSFFSDSENEDNDFELDFKDDSITPALNDEVGSKGFTEELISQEEDAIPTEINDKLDDLFSDSEEEEVKAEEDDFELDLEDDTIAPALNDEIEDKGVTEEITSKEEGAIPTEIDDKLDDLFSDSEEEEDDFELDLEDDTIAPALNDEIEDKGVTEEITSEEEGLIPTEIDELVTISSQRNSLESTDIGAQLDSLLPDNEDLEEVVEIEDLSVLELDEELEISTDEDSKGENLEDELLEIETTQDSEEDSAIDEDLSVLELDEELEISTDEDSKGENLEDELLEIETALDSEEDDIIVDSNLSDDEQLPVLELDEELEISTTEDDSMSLEEELLDISVALDAEEDSLTDYQSDNEQLTVLDLDENLGISEKDTELMSLEEELLSISSELDKGGEGAVAYDTDAVDSELAVLSFDDNELAAATSDTSQVSVMPAAREILPLTATISQLAASPTRELIEKGKLQIDSAFATKPNPGEKTLLQLLDSALTTIYMQNEKTISKNSLQLISFINEQIKQGSHDQITISNTVALYTTWQQDFIHELTVPEKYIPENLEKIKEDIRKDLKKEIDELRDEIRKLK